MSLPGQLKSDDSKEGDMEASMAKVVFPFEEIVKVARGAGYLPKLIEEVSCEDDTVYIKVKGISVGLKHVGFKDGAAEFVLVTPRLMLAAPLINIVLGYVRTRGRDRSREWLSVMLPKIAVNVEALLKERVGGVAISYLRLSQGRLEVSAQVDGFHRK